MIERYTKMDKHGHYYVNETIHDRGLTCNVEGRWEKSLDISAYDGKPIDRLAEYENSGLAPENVVALGNALKTVGASLDQMLATISSGEFSPERRTTSTLVFLFDSDKKGVIMAHDHNNPHPYAFEFIGGKIEADQPADPVQYTYRKIDELGISTDKIDRLMMYQIIHDHMGDTLTVFYGVLKEGMNFVQPNDITLYWIPVSDIISPTDGRTLDRPAFISGAKVSYLMNLALTIDSARIIHE